MGRLIRFPQPPPEAEGRPPTRGVVRDLKLATLPAAYAGRQVAGMGRRMRGQSRAQVQADIQARTAQHLFEVLGELKGCAAKVGQLMSIYRMTLPRDLAEPFGEALSTLQYAAPPMLPGLVHEVMRAQLGTGWRDLFLEFDDQRAASASLGQVHHAVWRDGRPVAVKVMYPGSREAARSDLRRLQWMTGLIGAFMPGADVGAVIAAVCDCVDDELDFAREARHQRILAEAFADDPDFVLPGVVEQTEDVLITEWLDGVPLTRIIAGEVRHQDRNQLGLKVIRFLMLAKARTGLLYSDPHPGNFLRMPDGRLGVVDFGACGPVPSNLPAVEFDIGEALYHGGPAELEIALRTHGFVQPGNELDIDELTDIVFPFVKVLHQPDYQLTDDWLRRQVRVITELRLSNVFRQMTLPPELVTVARASLTAFGMLCQLGTEGPIRAELLLGSPALDDVLRRYDEAVRSAL
ncbi:ABC1 kinase family protein [Nocardia sp. NBC_00511]|uniref:ABC1 kinase family protein n=1 Tax=Nocardia sp. NBC_00511 TaxID=2903591 RepID=UPI0030E1110D